MLLRQVEVLLAVLQEGSFTLAADRMEMTQPAVSHAVATLEKNLSLRLLQRGRTGVQLTPDGQRLLPHFQKLARTAEHLREEAARGPDTLSGKVRIGSFPSTSIHVLPHVIRAMAEQYPRVEVLIFEGLPD
ncbi:LysR family transcriptional regulator [Deinococcus hopiensis]|uniref:LysR family transcriptional regulator n=1 Tax=Deinococcus hopiensis TaxID=309885 RepID=UPI000A0554CF|nr:LysR family transcriptional regulator [Deinococcus hopiensis]